MNEEEREASLRRAFEAMRRADERAAPSFEAMRAEVEVRAAQPATVPTNVLTNKAPPHGPRRLRALVPLVAASAVAAAAMVFVITNPSAPPQAASRAKSSEAPASLALPQSSRTRVRPPAFDLDFLLDVPGGSTLAAIPDFDSDPVRSMSRVP